jgi:ascorbate-specific PTS system EIIC-type component UlaA
MFLFLKTLFNFFGDVDIFKFFNEPPEKKFLEPTLGVIGHLVILNLGYIVASFPLGRYTLSRPVYILGQHCLFAKCMTIIVHLQIP